MGLSLPLLPSTAGLAAQSGELLGCSCILKQQLSEEGVYILNHGFRTWCLNMCQSSCLSVLSLPALFPSSSGYSKACLRMGAAPSLCPGPNTVQYSNVQLCFPWCWHPGALSCCATAFSASIASFRLSYVCSFYTLEMKCILLLGDLHCLCNPSASSYVPSVQLPLTP